MSLLEKCAVSDTRLWFQKAVPNPVDKNRSTQLGVHLEEVAEMLKALVATNHTTQILLDNAVDSLEALADTIKTLGNQVEIEDPLEFLERNVVHPVVLRVLHDGEPVETVAMLETFRDDFAEV